MGSMGIRFGNPMGIQWGLWEWESNMRGSLNSKRLLGHQGICHLIPTRAPQLDFVILAAFHRWINFDSIQELPEFGSNGEEKTPNSLPRSSFQSQISIDFRWPWNPPQKSPHFGGEGQIMTSMTSGLKRAWRQLSAKPELPWTGRGIYGDFTQGWARWIMETEWILNGYLHQHFSSPFLHWFDGDESCFHIVFMEFMYGDTV